MKNTKIAIFFAASLTLNVVLIVAGPLFYASRSNEKLTETNKMLEQVLQNQRGQVLSTAIAGRSGNLDQDINHAKIEQLFRNVLSDMIKEEISEIGAIL